MKTKPAKVVKRQLLVPNKPGLAGNFFKPCKGGQMKFMGNLNSKKS